MRLFLLAENGIKVPIVCWIVEYMPIAIIAVGALVAFIIHIVEKKRR